MYQVVFFFLEIIYLVNNLMLDFHHHPLCGIFLCDKPAISYLQSENNSQHRNFRKLS